MVSPIGLKIDSLQEEIIQDPSKYVELDPDMAQTLLDIRQSVSSIGLHSICSSTALQLFPSKCPVLALIDI